MLLVEELSSEKGFDGASGCEEVGIVGESTDGGTAAVEGGRACC